MSAQAQVSAQVSAQPAQVSAQVQDPLVSAQVTPAQVQVCWLKEAKQGPEGGFLEHAQAFRDELETIVQILHDSFPSLRLCYVSSRIYAGYAVNFNGQVFGIGSNYTPNLPTYGELRELMKPDHP